MKTKNVINLKLATAIFVAGMVQSLPAFANSIPEGAFKFDGREHIYYSNGQGHYCYYDSLRNYVKLNGDRGWKVMPGRLSQYNMVFDGICTGTPHSRPAPHPDPYF